MRFLNAMAVWGANRAGPIVNLDCVGSVSRTQLGPGFTKLVLILAGCGEG